MMGHNSNSRVEQIQAIVARYAETHRKSQELNDERSELRGEAKDLGLDTKALQEEVRLSMEAATNTKREGFDESAKEIREAIKGMNAEEVWKHVFERNARKNKEREEKLAAKEKAKKSADSFKPAPDRKPKPVKSVGAEQAKAVLAADKDQQAVA